MTLRPGVLIHEAPHGAQVKLLPPGGDHIAVVLHPEMQPYFVAMDGRTEPVRIDGSATEKGERA